MLLLVFAGRGAARQYRFGVYILDLYGFDQINNSFCADLWIWAVYFGAETDFEGKIDAVNAKTFETEIYSSVYLPESSQYWMQQKIQGEFKCGWNMKNFPFDTTVLKMYFESDREAGDVTFCADTENSSVAKTVQLSGWKICGFEISDRLAAYDTTFGNPLAQSGGSDYSRILVNITVKRMSPWITFFKLSAGVYISFIISLLPFFMKPETDSRLSLPCAALFAVVSNKYIVEAAVPSSTSLTLMDSIHSLTMFGILVIFIILILTDGMRVSREKSTVEKSFRIDYLSVLLLTGIYITCNLYLVIAAFRSP